MAQMHMTNCDDDDLKPFHNSHMTLHSPGDKIKHTQTHTHCLLLNGCSQAQLLKEDRRVGVCKSHSRTPRNTALCLW